MEAQRDNLFSFGLDNQSRQDLIETARWAKFLAIVSFIGMGLILLFGLFGSFLLGSAIDSVDNPYTRSSATSSAIGLVFGIIVVIALYIYPTIAMMRFGSNIRPAIEAQDQGRFNMAISNLKGMFKYIGIVTIIVLAIYALFFLVAGLGAAMR